MATVAELRKIKDAAKRATEAQRFITRGDAALTEAREIRDEAIRAWRNTATQREIAEALGVTPGLIGQIDSKVTKVEKV